MNNNFYFQKALPEEVVQIAKLEQQCFGEEGFLKKQVDYLVRKAEGEVVVIKFSEKIVASLILLFRKGSRHIRIYSLAVSPDFRGKGLAKEMLVYSEKKASEMNLKQISLEVNEKNTGAIELYQKSGFQVYKTKNNYYKDGSKALVMRKTSGLL